MTAGGSGRFRRTGRLCWSGRVLRSWRIRRTRGIWRARRFRRSGRVRRARRALRVRCRIRRLRRLLGVPRARRRDEHPRAAAHGPTARHGTGTPDARDRGSFGPDRERRGSHRARLALGSCPGRVVYEALNQPEPMTFVYRAEGADAMAAINRALDDTGFQVKAVHAEGLTAPARPTALPTTLASALIGQVPHDANWPDRIAELLAG